jgi:hypothetical protein
VNDFVNLDKICGKCVYGLCSEKWPLSSLVVRLLYWHSYLCAFVKLQKET